MTQIPTIAQLVQRFRHLATVQNAGLAVALLMAFSWVWGAVATLQRNYQYQRQVDANNLAIELAKLQNQNYGYQQAYYKSNEYLELSARSELGKAQPGERLVLLPDSSAIQDTAKVPAPVLAAKEEQTNLERWYDFFFGKR